MNNIDLKILTVNAVRYALGRNTYVVDETIDIITKNIDEFSIDTIRRFIIDIQWQEKNGGLGHKCDHEDWSNFKIFLLNEIRKR